MKRTISKKIMSALYQKDINLSGILKLTGHDSKTVKVVKAQLHKWQEEGNIVKSGDNYRIAKRKAVFKAEIMRVFRAHGFIRNIATEEEYFVPGKYLMGGVPGDIVLARELDRRGLDNGHNDKAASVFMITEDTKNTLVGVIVAENEQLFLLPDSFISPPLVIIKYGGNKIVAGDKVSFKLHKRAEKHSEHMVDIVSVYGAAENAKIAVEAYIDEKNIPYEFPSAAADDARLIATRGISEKEIQGRTDLRSLRIFTIDGADTKDIDDAISIKKTEDGFELGVHIADVSYYVEKNSALDKEAFFRGTSVYIANLVIPMLPKELSNGICSLNPNENRLAFSCLMKIRNNGELVSFEFVKSVIKSTLQGVYSEINAIIDKSASEVILNKYKPVLEDITVMEELAIILAAKRKERGAPPINTTESKIICDDSGKCVDIVPRQGGVSEGIIEEFMLMANKAAATLAMEAQIPFVYRIHEPPTEEKLETLRNSLLLLGINCNSIREARDLQEILEKEENGDKLTVVNNLVLRTMMKAKYSPEPIGHFGLVMKEYAHFTSPIRRYPDLAIHRILSEYVGGLRGEKLNKKYNKFAHEASIHSSSTELIAVNAERDCEKFYMAEFMKSHIGEEFEGVISGVSKGGIFVLLPNTVEGRIDTAELITGLYADFEVLQNICLISLHDNTKYTVGDRIYVKCTGASVSLGMINFIIIKH